MTPVKQRSLKPGERIRVMVVDDSVVIRRLVTKALADDPMLEVVGTASNGAIGLQRIPELKPDLITLDIEMPDMNGLEMLKRVRQEYPGTIRRSIGITDNLAIIFGHKPGKAPGIYLVPAASHLEFLWRLGLKRSRAVAHMMGVDGRDGLDIGFDRGPDDDRHRLRSVNVRKVPGNL
jgi:CheY-like chemotaxis protein